MEKKHTNDEIDLSYLFNKIKEGYNKLLSNLYGLFKTIIRLWYLVILFLVVGVILGYLNENNETSTYESSLVVQMSQKSTAYIYNQIDFLNKSFRNNEFLKENGLKKNEILRFDIEAIPDFSEVLDSYENQNTNVIEYLLDNASAEDILRSEFFRTSYRFHNIEIVFGENYSPETISKFIKVLNKNKNYKEIANFYNDYYPMKVNELNKMNGQIDSIISNYTRVPTAKTPINSIYLGEESENLPRLIEYKNYILRFLEEANYDAIMGDKMISLINEPYVVKKKPFLRALILYPLLAFVLFLIVLGLFNTFAKAKKLYIEEQITVK